MFSQATTQLRMEHLETKRSEQVGTERKNSAIRELFFIHLLLYKNRLPESADAIREAN
jgi:hypothetical protein